MKGVFNTLFLVQLASSTKSKFQKKKNSSLTDPALYYNNY